MFAGANGMLALKIFAGFAWISAIGIGAARDLTEQPYITVSDLWDADQALSCNWSRPISRWDASPLTPSKLLFMRGFKMRGREICSVDMNASKNAIHDLIRKLGTEVKNCKKPAAKALQMNEIVDFSPTPAPAPCCLRCDEINNRFNLFLPTPHACMGPWGWNLGEIGVEVQAVGGRPVFGVP
jgi:hypothetical protein